jgi:hypothetical protein
MAGIVFWEERMARLSWQAYLKYFNSALRRFDIWQPHGQARDFCSKAKAAMAKPSQGFSAG